MAISSTNIKVYPTAYRGEHTEVTGGTSTKKVYNPGSRLFTEENITRPYAILATFEKDDYKPKGSFVISTSPTENPFKFVISGYYFELKGYTFDSSKKYYAKINLQNIGTDDPNNVVLYTQYMLPIPQDAQTSINNVSALDESGNFLGLEIIEENPSDAAPSGDSYTYLLLVDQGVVPDISLIKYEASAVEGGEDKPLSKFLKTNDIKIVNTLVDVNDPHDTQIDFANSVATIKTINATTSVTTPKVYTPSIDNLNSNSNFSLQSTKKITVEAAGDGASPDGSDLLHLKTTGDLSHIKLETTKEGSNINIDAKNSVSIIAEQSEIALQSGINPEEEYVLPSVSEDEPNDFTDPHIIATREWIKESWSDHGTGNAIVTFKIADQTFNQTVDNVAHATNAATVTFADGSSGKKYLLVSEKESGQAGNVCRSSNSIYVNGNTFNATSIAAQGSIQAQTFMALSDINLKENIVTYKPEHSILDLNVYQFNFKGSTKPEIGCIAQELQKICPEIVHENEQGNLSIEETKLVYLLLEEVKKLRKEVDELKK